jgi:hypothetical protein
LKGVGTNTVPGYNQPSLKKVAAECKFLHDNESLLTVQKLNEALRDRVRHDENKENRPSGRHDKPEASVFSIPHGRKSSPIVPNILFLL